MRLRNPDEAKHRGGRGLIGPSLQAAVLLAPAFLGLALACRPSGSPPRLLQDCHAGPPPEPAAWAVFELSLDDRGRPHEDSISLLLAQHPAWDAEGNASQAHRWLTAAYQKSLATRWQVDADSDADAGVLRLARLLITPSGELYCIDEISQVPRLPQALRLREQAVKHLGGAEVDGATRLDVVWSQWAAFTARWPFFYDETDAPAGLPEKLATAQSASGGFWLCRLRRRPHSGQLLFFDAQGEMLGRANYWIGE